MFSRDFILTTDGEDHPVYYEQETIKIMRSMDIKVGEFVGVLGTANHIIFVAPKKSQSKDGLISLDICKRIIQALQKHHNKASLSSIQTNDFIEHGSPPPGASLALIRDWWQNGPLFGSEYILNRKSSGRIHWKQTMSRFLPAVYSNRPLYVETLSIRKDPRREHEIGEIYQKCISIAIEKYGHIFLSQTEIARYHPGLCSTENLDFHKLAKIVQNYRASASATREIDVCDLIITFLSNSAKSNQTSTFVFGTRKFEIVWQEMCQDVLGQSALNIVVPHAKYLDLERPIKSHLRPDLVRLLGDSLVVLDAKYYDLSASYYVPRQMAEI